MSLPRPSVQTLASNCFTGIKERASACLSKLSRTGENIDFVKRGKKEGDNELHDFGSIQRQQSSFDGGEFDASGDKITEWQAGWNVTNAIQVGLFVNFHPARLSPD